LSLVESHPSRRARSRVKFAKEVKGTKDLWSSRVGDVVYHDPERTSWSETSFKRASSSGKVEGTNRDPAPCSARNPDRSDVSPGSSPTASCSSPRLPPFFQAWRVPSLKIATVKAISGLSERPQIGGDVPLKLIAALRSVIRRSGTRSLMTKRAFAHFSDSIRREIL
jgi:hypothetical protein